MRDLVEIPLDEDEWYALLQHYGWLTHHLDVTLNFEIAIWFALYKHKLNSTAVVYAINLGALPSTVREVNHNSLRTPDYEQLNCRWVEQSGAMLVPTEWPQMTAAEELDLRSPKFADCVWRFEFLPIPDDCAYVAGNPMETSSDWIAPIVRNVIHFVAGGVEAYHPIIQKCIAAVG